MTWSLQKQLAVVCWEWRVTWWGLHAPNCFIFHESSIRSFLFVESGTAIIKLLMLFLWNIVNCTGGFHAFLICTPNELWDYTLSEEIKVLVQVPASFKQLQLEFLIVAPSVFVSCGCYVFYTKDCKNYLILIHIYQPFETTFLPTCIQLWVVVLCHLLYSKDCSEAPTPTHQGGILDLNCNPKCNNEIIFQQDMTNKIVLSF